MGRFAAQDGSVRARGSAGRCARSPDRGSATVWTAVLATALCAVFAVILSLGQVVVARHRAGGAADLAALAAADHALKGQSPACDEARRVAAAQGARVVRCAIIGEIADLTAEAVSGPFASRVRARAGPAARDIDPGASHGPGTAEGRDPPDAKDASCRDCTHEASEG
ncbi:Rv3654c family TadE-like protein [Streptomyces sp. NPDC047108]|uniref:Rv3654c family TadE-like protein n=1 Tax=Streptomyces sp. NPDC047108 TaxID=3155025 RepID=UPI003400C042